MPVRDLTFTAVDELAFAAVGGRPLTDIPAESYMPSELGPLMEFLFLLSSGIFPDSAQSWLVSRRLTHFLGAWYDGHNSWLSEDARLGLIHTNGISSTCDVALTRFLMSVQRSAREVSRLPGTTPGQMAAAIQELEGNIQEHSNAPATGIIAFRATAGVFEFVVADRGIGLLASLRQNTAFSLLADHGKALELALTDGTSRYTEAGRGHGFRPIFVGLTNLRGRLRFRSGDHALSMDGTGPTLASAQVSQKPSFQGFFASVSCRI